MWGQDAKELARIERKKRVEEERKSRIFDSKARTMGVITYTLKKFIT